MKQIRIILVLVLLVSVIYSNPISWPYLPVNDYFRGTAGERLFFSFAKYNKGSFWINNDFRYYKFDHYWEVTGDKFECDPYSRLINIFSVGYLPFDKIQLSIRIPYVSLKNLNLSNAGLSDIFIGFSCQMFEFNEKNNISFSSGIKIPVGYYKYNKYKLPLGTGSYDIPFIVNSNFQKRSYQLFLDAGYILIGKSEGIYPSYNVGKKFNNGDEIFSDIVLAKMTRIATLKVEANYFYVFSSYPDLGDWTDSQSKFSVTPGVILPLPVTNFSLELSYTFDLFGKYTFSGSSPVIRISYF